MNNQIIPNEHFNQQCGEAFYLLHKILNEIPNQYYQPIHWDHKPTNEEIAYEKAYLQSTCDAANRVLDMSRELYSILTGQKIYSLGENLKKSVNE